MQSMFAAIIFEDVTDTCYRRYVDMFFCFVSVDTWEVKDLLGSGRNGCVAVSESFILALLKLVVKSRIQEIVF